MHSKNLKSVLSDKTRGIFFFHGVGKRHVEDGKGFVNIVQIGKCFAFVCNIDSYSVYVYLEM